MWLCLHGFMGAPAFWTGVTSELQQTPIVAPVLAGHGPDPDCSAHTFGDEIDRLYAMSKVHPRPRYLCGYSMGARLAIGLLAEHPDLFDGAVLISGHAGLRDATARKVRACVDAERIAVLEAQGVEAFVDVWQTLPLFETQGQVDKRALARQREMRLSHSHTGLGFALGTLGAAAMPDYHDRVGAAAARTVVLAGANDPAYVVHAKTIASLMPRSKLRVLDGVGHNPVLEAPNQVREILRTCDAP